MWFNRNLAIDLIREYLIANATALLLIENCELGNKECMGKI